MTAAETIIQFEQFTYCYPNSQHSALNNVELKIKKGSFVGFTGPAGAGKTTLLKSINGIIPYFEGGAVGGSVYIKGRPVRDMSLPQISRVVGTVLDDPEAQVICLDVEQELAFGMENFGIDPSEMEQRMVTALSSVGIAHLRGRSTHSLSGGEKQRLAIAAALVIQPEILILDEPTSELDPLGSEEVFKVLRRLNIEQGITVLVTEQKTDLLASCCHRLVVLNQGSILLDGSPGEVFKDKNILQLGVAIPQVTELAHQFDNLDIDMPITLEEGVQYCQTLLNQRR
ncbi:energy-coupling factor ABC transporter ATP-binding protein [Desulfoscipio gibsoniae]|uniref:ABC-type cobalt transport system, ATPase component n=1 Tax=Desulfoscipio gibsoniae DSM 7213 TaxID=767817 RepID=R4KJX1_9FIRM|nr:ABC transporter ATP-binding protein [Desulfoscipio gibsoniae]AGL02929.1 ABC-type cobalt transport system, ATPase component [Desulfoscipio gibsoniae DSM 7213]